MQKLVIDCKTGASQTVQLTSTEIAALQQAGAAAQARDTAAAKERARRDAALARVQAAAASNPVIADLLTYLDPRPL